jgi:hypothetical protein
LSLELDCSFARVYPRLCLEPPKAAPRTNPSCCGSSFSATNATRALDVRFPHDTQRPVEKEILSRSSSSSSVIGKLGPQKTPASLEDQESRAGASLAQTGRRRSRGSKTKPPRVSRHSLPYAAQDLAQHIVPDPSSPVSVVMVTAMVMAAVTSPFDEPQHLLRATEDSPDLADVHVLLALFRTISAKP